MTRIDLPLFQGDTFDGVVSVTNADGTPADLTGATAKAQIRRTYADSDPTVAAEIQCAIVLPDRIYIKLSSAQTQALSGNYVWDLQLTMPAVTVTTIVSGKVVVTPEVTRSSAVPTAKINYARREIVLR